MYAGHSSPQASLRTLIEWGGYLNYWFQRCKASPVSFRVVPHSKNLEADSFVGDAEDSAVGDLKGLSPNAQTMVKMAVLSAWAELQVASTEQPYLIDVVKPHIAKLTPLWLESLQEFARLRFEPDISNSTASSNPNNSLDIMYSALNRQTLLKVHPLKPESSYEMLSLYSSTKIRG